MANVMLEIFGSFSLVMNFDVPVYKVCIFASDFELRVYKY